MYEDPLRGYIDIDLVYELGSMDYDPLTMLLKDEEDEELSIPSVSLSLKFQQENYNDHNN